MTVFLIIDDHPIVRRGIHQILMEYNGNVRIHEAGTAEEGLKKAREIRTDLVLLDINLPGRSGLDVIEDIRRARPETKILILSMYPEEQYAIRALRSGASGYLAKDSAPDELLKAVSRILQGGRYITQSMAEHIYEILDGEKTPHHHLSNRELEVMRHLARGKSIKDIAAELHLSEKTISTYRGRILEKMRMHSNADIVRYAIQNRLID